MVFNYNDTLIIEAPYASVVKREFKKSLCSYCFHENTKLLTCTQCNLNCYCNKECQRKDWKQHKLECKSFAFGKIYPHDISLLILRLMCKSKIGCDSETVGIISNKYGFKPRCFNDLVLHMEHDKSNISSNFDSMMKELSTFLHQINIDLKEFISEDAAKIIFSKSITNNFEIQNDLGETIGYGCYLNGSGLNHSCWPNSIYSFQGNRMELRALKRIENDEQIFINYTDPLQLRADRRSRLREQYLFECCCVACSNDDLEKEMSQLFCVQPDCFGSVMWIGGQSEDYRCGTCGMVEKKTEMDLRHSIYKAKLYHINNLMFNNEYQKALELCKRELADFHLDIQKENCGGLIQLCFGEKAFESALFLNDFHSALEICRMKQGSNSWIQERLSRFLGTENHSIARNHLEKFKNLLEYFS